MGYIEVLLLRAVLRDVHPRDCEYCAHDEFAASGLAGNCHSPYIPGSRVATEGGIGGGSKVVDEFEVKEANGGIQPGGCAVVDKSCCEVTLYRVLNAVAA